MGRYTGIVQSLPSGSRHGRIRSSAIAAPVLFDLAAFNAAGGVIEGARVSFELRSSGMAYKIRGSTLKNYNTLTRRRKVIQSPAGN